MRIWVEEPASFSGQHCQLQDWRSGRCVCACMVRCKGGCMRFLVCACLVPLQTMLYPTTMRTLAVVHHAQDC
jgi:hypothetical protein